MDHNCASCSSSTTKVIDFGEEALAGAYLKREQFSSEKRYPLQVYFCQTCALVQLGEKVSADTLFREYHYFSSATRTACEHFARYAEGLINRFKPRSVLEVGCNDGVLLTHFAGRAEVVIGVDPAANVTRSISDERITVLSEFFTESTSERVRLEYGKVDLVVANNVFAHVDDIHGLTRAVRDVLTDDGVFVLEIHDLAAMVSEMQYDWIYHEHLYYWSLLALERHLARHGLQIFDVSSVAAHGGSRRYYVCKNAARPISGIVEHVRRQEITSGLDSLDTFLNFAWAVKDHGKNLRDALSSLRTGHQVIGGYGASGRANALIQHSKLGEYLHCMYDDAPARARTFTPGSHLYINQGDILHDSSVPDHLVLFAWGYMQEIAERRSHFRGNVIVPLPEISMRRFFVSDGKRMVI